MCKTLNTLKGETGKGTLIGEEWRRGWGRYIDMTETLPSKMFAIWWDKTDTENDKRRK